jgi:hypothetical protein
VTETIDLLLTHAEKAGLTIISESQKTLEPALRALHKAVLQRFLDTGTAPSLDWLTDQARSLDLDPDAAWSKLDEADLVHCDGEAVVVAYPFSGTETTDRVELDGGPSLWAMCAIDALGILLMTGRNGVITSTDPQGLGPVRVERKGATWIWTPESTVVLAGAGQPSRIAAESCCPHVAFHTDAKHADAYLQIHPELSGYVLDQNQALEAANLVFGALLREPESECSS